MAEREQSGAGEPPAGEVLFLPSGVRVREADDPTPAGLPGSLLASAFRGRVALPHICGGYGGCGSCRVRVVEGATLCSAPTPRERRRLERLGLTAPEDRLACQCVPPPGARLRVEVPPAPEMQGLVLDLPWTPGDA